MKKETHPAAPGLVTLALSAASTFGLHQMGDVPWLSVDWSNLGQWLDTTPPSEALLSAIRLVGLGCGWWILLSTCLYLTARLRGATAVLRIATPLTPSFIRSLSAKVAVGAVTVTTLGNTVPALAADPLPAAGQFDSYPVPLGAPNSPSVVTHPTPQLHRLRFPLPWLDPELPDPPVVATDTEEEETPHPLPSPSTLTTPAGSYRIVKGDHLWGIAKRVLSKMMDHPPTTEQIVSYWVDLIETNRETIASGDPNLIYPGEQITLPEIRKV